MTDKIDTLTLAAINLVLIIALCLALWGFTALMPIALAATPLVLFAIIRLTINGGVSPDHPS